MDENNLIKSASKTDKPHFVDFVRSMLNRIAEEKEYFSLCKENVEDEIFQFVKAIRARTLPVRGELLLFQEHIKRRSTYSPDAVLYVFVANLRIYTCFLQEALSGYATVEMCKSNKENTVNDEIKIILP